MRIINASETGTLVLGFQGEDQRLEIRFPLVDEKTGRNITEEFPGGRFSISIMLPGDPAEHIVGSEDFRIEGNWLIWTVKEAYTVGFGEGKLQLNYAFGGMVKSRIWKTNVRKSINSGSGTVPSWSDWKTELLNAAAAVESAVDSYDEMTAEAEELPAGSTPTAEMDHTGDHPVLKLGIPASQGGGGGDVQSVNGKTGVVVLNANDVGALPSSTPIPPEVTVDSELSGTSTNPVQNKVIKAKLDEQSETIVNLPQNRTSADVGSDLDISDESGHVLMRLTDGNVQTENFDSEKAVTVSRTLEPEPDFDFMDTNGNVILRLEGGHIKTQKFDSSAVFADILINLPEKVYALEGLETNIYFENLVEDWTKYHWDVTCSVGMQLERGFRITPLAAQAGVYPLTITATDGIVTGKAVTTLVVTAASAGNGVSKSVLVLGDSTTDGGTAITKLNADFSGDVMSISTVGTRGTSPNNHEGRSGWSFDKYFNTQTDSGGITNAFFNPTTHTFDADYYFDNSGVSAPDWFFINLGINDMFGYSTDAEVMTHIAECESRLDEMISSILTASSDTKVGICLTIPPNHSQDAFGKEYGCGQNRDRYKRNNLLWVHRLIEKYDSRESERVYIVPIYYALDTVNNMGFEAEQVNARNETTYQAPVGNGGVHPVTSGYWQIADVYAAFIKAHV